MLFALGSYRLLMMDKAPMIVDHREGTKGADPVRTCLLAHAVGTASFLGGGNFTDADGATQGCLPRSDPTGFFTNGSTLPENNPHTGLEWRIEILSTAERQKIRSPLTVPQLRGKDGLDLEEAQFGQMGNSVSRQPQT